MLKDGNFKKGGKLEKKVGKGGNFNAQNKSHWNVFNKYTSCISFHREGGREGGRQTDTWDLG